MVRRIAQPLDHSTEFFRKGLILFVSDRKDSERFIVQSEFANCCAPQPAVRHESRVTDLATNRSVVVVITDRGPRVRDRVLDLSLGAARSLGITDRGVAQVRVEVL